MILDAGIVFSYFVFLIEILLAFSFTFKETLDYATLERDPDKGFSGIEVCQKVPGAVFQVAKAKMLEKTIEKDYQRKRKAAAGWAKQKVTSEPVK